MSAGLKYFERLSYLSDLIKKERTGCCSQLAKTFNVSERTVYRMISDLCLHYEKAVKYYKDKNSFIFE
ncbi:hypothetical protein GCM10011506_25630 [Marivirga lumbricoides]|uniref:Helix-turn-helix type 11 domain-containing protein n=1 Tax=Marivirga lumbricoides TaxID=1046115 RepID=A0ABQ1MHD1_9BACT|nr:hypothetical protein GCM10011506_25630 [Marivirga lumbricoides]